ncbi:unnamed protein product [Linum trigynum]|uniref:Uncharacterized protein n=1 Tax=Linum trigynum TaxID=586398 RepID=A0AAV2E7R4_9ROSI
MEILPSIWVDVTAEGDGGDERHGGGRRSGSSLVLYPSYATHLLHFPFQLKLLDFKMEILPSIWVDVTAEGDGGDERHGGGRRSGSSLVLFPSYATHLLRFPFQLKLLDFKMEILPSIWVDLASVGFQGKVKGVISISQ